MPASNEVTAKQALIAMFVFSLIGGVAVQAGAEGQQAPDKPIELKSSASKKMWVKFDHASHDSIDCDVCHHAEPSTPSRAYVSCSSSEECHSLKGTKGTRRAEPVLGLPHQEFGTLLLRLSYDDSAEGLPPLPHEPASS